VRYRFLGTSKSNAKPIGRNLLPSSWHGWKLRERPSLYPGVTTDETWALHNGLETKGKPWYDTVLNLHGKQSESSQGGKVMITVF
jgi:hypothetical protein